LTPRTAPWKSIHAEISADDVVVVTPVGSVDSNQLGPGVQPLVPGHRRLRPRPQAARFLVG